jgi:hypothetical protein
MVLSAAPCRARVRALHLPCLSYGRLPRPSGFLEGSGPARTAVGVRKASRCKPCHDFLYTSSEFSRLYSMWAPSMRCERARTATIATPGKAIDLLCEGTTLDVFSRLHHAMPSMYHEPILSMRWGRVAPLARAGDNQRQKSTRRVFAAAPWSPPWRVVSALCRRRGQPLLQAPRQLPQLRRV